MFFFSPTHRQHPRGFNGPILHRPVRTGAHQAARHPPHAVRGALLSCLLAHPQDGAGSLPPVPPVRHPGPLPKRHLRGGERRDACRRRGPVQHAHQDGECTKGGVSWQFELSCCCQNTQVTQKGLKCTLLECSVGFGGNN